PEYGSIHTGKAADLVLLDADPTVDINNTTRIGRVMRSGVWIDQAPAPTLDVEDYVETPITGVVDGKGTNDLLLSRVNTLREEVGGAGRFFIPDPNRPLYIFDKATKQFSVYLDFNGGEGKRGIF